jgi:hypothetical protein
VALPRAARHALWTPLAFPNGQLSDAGHGSVRVTPMMFWIFLFLTLAFGLEFAGRTRWSIASLAVSLVLTAWLFQFEIHSATTGFSMPWLKVDNGIVTLSKEV